MVKAFLHSAEFLSGGLFTCIIGLTYKQIGRMKMDKDTLYYFIGIKGSGMSALALILHDQGLQVAGSRD